MKFLNSAVLTALLVLFVSRAVTLSQLDLIDPTESRYAVIAQEMVVSGDWIVPKLPVRDTIEPYLGKPPLHFWLTAASLTAFGFAEWASRLPAFLGFLAIGAMLLSLGTSMWGVRDAKALPAVFTLSSGLFFFYGGGSVVDMTLTASVTLIYVSLYRFVKDGRWGLGVFIGAALGFLTKGPVAGALSFPGLLVWLFMTGNLGSLKRLPWTRGILLGLLIVVPWFIAIERRQPDAFEYFFWNENVGRYLFKNYGDKYGTGHRYPFGSAWWMLAAACAPWSLVLLWRIKRILRLPFRSDPDLMFSLCWALGPPLFFTAAKQLLPSYILPAVPGVSLLLSQLIVRSANSEADGESAVLVPWMRTSMGFSIFFCLAIFIAAPWINADRSIARTLDTAVQLVPDAEPTIRIVGKLPYSAIWYSRAWRGEIAKPFRFQWLEEFDYTLDNQLVRPKYLQVRPRGSMPIGEWIFVRNGAGG